MHVFRAHPEDELADAVGSQRPVHPNGESDAGAGSTCCTVEGGGRWEVVEGEVEQQTCSPFVATNCAPCCALTVSCTLLCADRTAVCFPCVLAPKLSKLRSWVGSTSALTTSASTSTSRRPRCTSPASGSARTAPCRWSRSTSSTRSRPRPRTSRPRSRTPVPRSLALALARAGSHMDRKSLSSICTQRLSHTHSLSITRTHSHDRSLLALALCCGVFLHRSRTPATAANSRSRCSTVSSGCTSLFTPRGDMPCVVPMPMR